MNDGLASKCNVMLAWQELCAAEQQCFGDSMTFHTVEPILRKFANSVRQVAGEPPPSGWQPIEALAKNDIGVYFFWVVPKTADESYTDTSGNPIVVKHNGYLHKGTRGSWGALSKATHWMFIPSAPAASASRPSDQEQP